MWPSFSTWAFMMIPVLVLNQFLLGCFSISSLSLTSLKKIILLSLLTPFLVIHSRLNVFSSKLCLKFTFLKASLSTPANNFYLNFPVSKPTLTQYIQSAVIQLEPNVCIYERCYYVLISPNFNIEKHLFFSFRYLNVLSCWSFIINFRVLSCFYSLFHHPKSLSFISLISFLAYYMYYNWESIFFYLIYYYTTDDPISPRYSFSFFKFNSENILISRW